LTIGTTDRDRWVVSLLWPHGAESHEYKPSDVDQKLGLVHRPIGVSKKRGLEALASDIQRRLLTTYFTEYNKQLALAKALFG